MHPVICQIGSVTIYSFGIMLAVAVVVCALLLSKDAKRFNLSPDFIFDLVFWATVMGLVGARIFYVLLNLPIFIANPVEIFKIQNGGLAWQGGLILGTAVVVFILKRKKLFLWDMADLIAPYIALGHGIGRIGCFLNGCCFGHEVPWGLYFPVHQARLHPTQLYESFSLIAIFFILKWFQTKNKFPGQVLVLYLFLASLERFVVEFFRADHTSTWVDLSIFQIVSLGIMAAAFYVYTLTKSRIRK